MAYIINRASGEQFLVLDDGTLNTSTSIGLLGRNYTGYGEVQNENFLWMLEHFANEAPPARPISGQLWFSTALKVMHVYDGTNWKPVGSATVSDSNPIGSDGALWLDSTTDQLYVFNGDEWKLIGPEAVPGFGVTKVVAKTLLATDSNSYPVLAVTVDDVVIAIHSSTNFTIDATNAIGGFDSVVVGTTMTTYAGGSIKGNLTGNADSATRLATPRKINGVNFDGQSDITISATTTGALIRGEYIFGSNYNGGSTVTWSVDATPLNTIGKVVARDASGNFSAGTITADLIGDVQGNVSAADGISSFNIVEAREFRGLSLSGNAYSASKLQTSRNINGVAFNGTADITVAAAAGTLTGNVLAPNITESSLTNVGFLTSLRVLDGGITIGNNSDIQFRIASGTVPELAIQNGLGFAITINDSKQAGGEASFEFISSDVALAAGGLNDPAFIGDSNSKCNIGLPGRTFGSIYADNFVGTASNATLAATATNIDGGAVGSLLYQSSPNVTGKLPIGSTGQVLKVVGGSIAWSTISNERLKRKPSDSYITLTNSGGSTEYYDSTLETDISVNASTSNSPSTVVARDSSGNFSAGTITATLNGNASTASTATTATRLATPRTINGVAFDGTANITVSTNYTITSGNTVYSTSGYTNSVGSWNNNANYFDVFPPSGKSMANLVAFIPSIAVIHWAGGVNGDDSTRCTWSDLGDRIRVYVQNTEQRSTPAANYMAIWS